MSKQAELKKFYENKFLDKTINKEYSSPLLISLDENINTDIMIIGQETNSWYENYEKFLKNRVDKQMEIYKNFMKKEYLKMNTMFWRYVKKIINDDNITPVFNNLFKFDLGDKRKDRNISKAPKNEYEQIIDFHQDILSKEIEIIKPKIIIFFTGHPYDKLFIDPIIKQNGDYKKLYKSIPSLSIDEWKCGILDLKNFKGFENFEGKAIRTYHPIYLNRNLDKFGNEIVEYLKNEITKERR